MTAGKRTRQPGFTLIELIITLLVMGVLATVAVPGFQALIAGNQQATSYNDMLSGFKLARSEAITRREEVTAHLEPQNDGGWRLTVENEEDESILSLGSTSESVNVSDELEVTFNSLGRRESCDPDECQVGIGSESLEISPAGRIDKPLDEAQEDDSDDDDD